MKIKIELTNKTVLFNSLATNMRNNGYKYTYEVTNTNGRMSIFTVRGYCPSDTRSQLAIALRRPNW